MGELWSVSCCCNCSEHPQNSALLLSWWHSKACMWAAGLRPAARLNSCHFWDKTSTLQSWEMTRCGGLAKYLLLAYHILFHKGIHIYWHESDQNLVVLCLSWEGRPHGHCFCGGDVYDGLLLMPQGKGLSLRGRAHSGPVGIIQESSNFWRKFLPWNCCIFILAPFILFLYDGCCAPLPL